MQAVRIVEFTQAEQTPGYLNHFKLIYHIIAESKFLRLISRVGNGFYKLKSIILSTLL